MIVYKIFGALKGVAPTLAETLQEFVGQESVFFKESVLHIEYEGFYIDTVTFVQAIQQALTSESSGKIDYIDAEEWTLTRCVIEQGLLQQNTVSLNKVLEYSGF